MKRTRQTDIQDFTLVKSKYNSTPNKERMLQEKKNASSLSSYKIVYSHDEDPDNTVILRSFYPDSPESLRRYGIRGREHIDEMFFGILNLIGTTKKEEMKEKCRYLSPVQINSLFELVDEMRESIGSMEFSTRTKETSNSNWFTYTTLSNKDDIGITTTKYPQICFLKKLENGSKTGVFLFITEIFKLLKYMNSKYGFSRHPSFCKNDILLYDDNFF